MNKKSLIAMDVEGVLLDYSTAYAKAREKAFGQHPVELKLFTTWHRRCTVTSRDLLEAPPHLQILASSQPKQARLQSHRDRHPIKKQATVGTSASSHP